VRLTRTSALSAACVAVATAAGTLVAAPAATAAEPTVPFISEFHYDNGGTDTGEFVEVQLPAGTSSAGWTVVLYNGSGGATYGTLNLPAVTAGGTSDVAVVAGPAAGIQNGSPDGLALVRPDSSVAEFLSYEGPMTATNGPAVGQTSTDVGVSENGSGAVGNSLSKRFSPATGNYVWQPEAPNTMGTVNPPLDEQPPVKPCEETPTHEIGQIQGTGASAAVTGQVRVRGVVVGDVPGLGGFYLQDADGDGNAATSDGIFVRSPIAVDLGDTVAVDGGAGEDFGQTQIVSQRDVAVCADGSAADLPAAAALDLPATDAQREPYEGMLVSPVDTLMVSEVFALTRFGELTLSQGGLLIQPTEVARPSTPEAAGVAADNAARKILLDDGTDASRSATNRPYLSATTPVRVGDKLTFTEKLVLGYGFGEWRLQPADGTPDGVFAPQNTRPAVAAPDEVGGDVQVGAFNVLNYFTTLTGPDARGATTPAAFAKQSAKIVTAISALDVDVVTLMEIEDTDSTGASPGNADGALADLVGKLNTFAGSDRWAYVPLPDELYAVDRDVIRSAIIYRKDVVQPVGDPVGLVDEDVWFNAREPQAQTFVKDGDRFTVVANHFKSKSPGAPTGDNVDTGDGQGEWNGDRMRQAASLASFVDDLKVSTGDNDVLLLGDFNSYTQEDPVEVLRDAGFTDLGSQFDPSRYSYVFDELSGSLDHAFGTESVTAKITDVAHWNINSVESFAYQYTGDPTLYSPNQFRSSDHDPLVLGIDLEERCNGLLPTIKGTNAAETLTGTNKNDVIMGLGGNDRITGANGNDVVCGGAGDDVIDGGNGDDVLLGGFGNDTVTGANGDDVLIGGPGTDVLTGGNGVNSITQDGAES
jgi:5'-nucleotidase